MQERIGIFEMAALTKFPRKSQLIRKAIREESIKLHQLEQIRKAQRVSKEKEMRFAFLTILANNFMIIPEGFTGVFMRNTECQIIPDALIPSIKALTVNGFEHIPEDHELHLFIERASTTGRAVNSRILEVVKKWMDDNIK